MKIQAYYADGTYEEFSMPELNFAQGYLIDNQRLIMTDWETEGVRVDRAFWPTPNEEEESGGMQICNATTLIEPNQLGHLQLLIVDGKTILERNGFDELVVNIPGAAVDDEDLSEEEE